MAIALFEPRLFELGEAYFNYRDVIPTQALLNASAAALEKRARALAAQHLGPGLSIVVISEPGSLVDRCIVYGGLILALASTSPSELKKHLGEWKDSIAEFSQEVIDSVQQAPLAPSLPTNDDKSVIVQRKRHAIGQIENIVDAARKLNENSNAPGLKQELISKVQVLLREAGSDDERAELIKMICKLSGVREALIVAAGSNYRKILQVPPAKKAKPRTKSRKLSRSPEDETEQQPGRRRLKRVVRQFSTK